MNEGFKIRIVIGIPKALLDKINRDVKSRPNTQDQRLLKCLEKGYAVLNSRSEGHGQGHP